MNGTGKKPVIFSFVFAVALLLAVVAHAQQPQVTARIDSPRILIGQQFHLYLEAKTDPSRAALRWTPVPDTFHHLMVVSRGKIDTLTQGNLQTYRQSVTLTGFDSGRWQIPAFSFKIIPLNSTDTQQLVSTQPLSVTVNTVAVDTTQPFRPIKNIRTVPVNIWDYWYVLLIAAVLILALVLWLRFRKKKRPQPAVVKTPGAPPFKTALEALHRLEEEKLWQQGAVKQYYTRLTDILRLYIENQFGIAAMEQTSDELLEHIKPVTRLNQQRESLQYILETGDLAKFAKLQPSPEEHQACLRKAYEVVEWTKPKPEEVSREGVKGQ